MGHTNFVLLQEKLLDILRLSCSPSVCLESNGTRKTYFYSNPVYPKTTKLKYYIALSTFSHFYIILSVSRLVICVGFSERTSLRSWICRWLSCNKIADNISSQFKIYIAVQLKICLKFIKIYTFLVFFLACFPKSVIGYRPRLCDLHLSKGLFQRLLRKKMRVA